MATVDLICAYDASTSSSWTSDGATALPDGSSAISAIDGTTTLITRGPGQLTSLGFTTNAATAIPAGATKTAVQLLVRLRVSGGNGYVYLKDPGGFADGGAAEHTLTFNTSLATYTSVDMAVERPVVLSNSLTSGYIRMFHDSGYTQTFTVDYVGLRVTYTEGGIALPVLFMGENF